MPSADTAQLEVTGDDAALAAAVAAAPDGALVQFRPSPESDFARALGIGPGGGPGRTVAVCDLLDVGPDATAVNAVVLGVAPDHLAARHRMHPVCVQVDGRVVFDGPATTVVVASGQFLRGADLVPRGHPGDGRAEIQVLALGRRERRSLRVRLPHGDHVPHPRITQASGRHIQVRWGSGEARFEVDGQRRHPRAEVEIVVRPGALRVLI